MSKSKFEEEEPPANFRQMARTFRDMYIALVKEGFSEAQALRIVGEMVTASIASAVKKDDQ